MIPLPISVSTLAEDDDLASLITLPYYEGTGAAATTEASVSLKVPDDGRIIPILHETDITEGTAVSLHMDDDSTSYQNISGKKAGAILTISCRGAGVLSRHFKLYSAPTDNSTAAATEIFDYDGDGKVGMDAAGEHLTVLIPESIQNNHYLVLENVDESRAGVNDIHVGRQAWIAEQA